MAEKVCEFGCCIKGLATTPALPLNSDHDEIDG